MLRVRCGVQFTPGGKEQEPLDRVVPWQEMVIRTLVADGAHEKVVHTFCEGTHE